MHTLHQVEHPPLSTFASFSGYPLSPFHTNNHCRCTETLFVWVAVDVSHTQHFSLQHQLARTGVRDAPSERRAAEGVRARERRGAARATRCARRHGREPTDSRAARRRRGGGTVAGRPPRRGRGGGGEGKSTRPAGRQPGRTARDQVRPRPAGPRLPHPRPDLHLSCASAPRTSVRACMCECASAGTRCDHLCLSGFPRTARDRPQAVRSESYGYWSDLGGPQSPVGRAATRSLSTGARTLAALKKKLTRNF